MNKNVTKLVGALSIAALASMGCASKEEKPAEGTSGGAQASCSAAGKPAEGETKPAEKSCSAGAEKKQ